MDLPVRVQANVLEVLPTPVPTDYVVVIVNAIMIILSVWLGYKLSERQRVRSEIRREYEAQLQVADSLTYNLRYALGVISVQRNYIAKWISGVNTCTKELEEEAVLNKLPSFQIHPIDYRTTTQLLAIIPNLNIELAGVEPCINSLNDAVTEEYQSFFAERSDIKSFFASLNYWNEALLECYDALSQLEIEVLLKGRNQLKAMLNEDLQKYPNRFDLVIYEETESMKKILSTARLNAEKLPN